MTLAAIALGRPLALGYAMDSALQPLLSREHQLDDLVAAARRAGEEAIAAAGLEAVAVREAQRRELTAELERRSADLSRELAALETTRRNEREERLARLRKSVEAHREEAIAMCLARVLGGTP